MLFFLFITRLIDHMVTLFICGFIQRWKYLLGRQWRIPCFCQWIFCEGVVVSIRRVYSWAQGHQQEQVPILCFSSKLFGSLGYGMVPGKSDSIHELLRRLKYIPQTHTQNKPTPNNTHTLTKETDRTNSEASPAVIDNSNQLVSLCCLLIAFIPAHNCCFSCRIWGCGILRRTRAWRCHMMVWFLDWLHLLWRDRLP